MIRRFTLAWIGLACCFGSLPALAQWTTQTIRLQPGWNAVYLEVQPEPRDCDALFAGLGVESVWVWNRRFSTVQFIQDPTQLLPGQPDWLNWVASTNPARATRNLYTLQGGQACLIKVPGQGVITWTLKGQPVNRPIDWLPNSFNLAGFPLASGSSLTFQALFAGSPAHSGQAIYRLNNIGVWERLANPASSVVLPGEAFWVFCQGPSTYSGPMQVQTDQRDGLLYGRQLLEQTLRIRNTSLAPTSFVLRRLPSLAPPDATFPLLAGAVPLTYFRIDAANLQFGWLPLPDEVERLDLPPGAEWVLRLSVDRTRMTDFTPPPAHNGVLYQGLLEISSDTGARQFIALSGEGLKSYAPTGPSAQLALQGRRRAGPDDPPHPRAGLWVGAAVVEKVSQPAHIDTPNTPLLAASPVQFRLIIHVDQAGNARLLQKVLQMFKNGTLKADPIDPTKKVVDQPGRYVLVTDEAHIPKFTGATVRDGQAVARRISSAAFGFTQPILFTATGEFGAGKFNCQVPLDYDHPLNPFKHKYHPDHDNLNDRFEQKLPEGVESFTITRAVELEFSAQDPDKLALPGWGDNQLGGTYRETITGLHKQVLHAAGTFRLTRASTIEVLNDGL